MIRYKNYQLFKTAKKTATVNNLVIAEKATNKEITRLFDFSLINDEYALNEVEREVIKNDALSHITGKAFNISYFGKEFDSFSYCDGVATYNVHNVYNKDTGKLLYRILEVAEIVNKRGTRKSIYDSYTVSVSIAHRVYSQPLNDYEI